jgi:DNA-binding MarR family transcriptional regulator
MTRSGDDRREAGDANAPLDPVGEAARQWRAHGVGAAAHMEAVANINRVSALIIGRVEEILIEFDLTFSQYEALVLLHFSREGALPLGRMGRRLTVHPTTVTNTVDQLERKGLVGRETTAADRRRVLAKITKAGNRVASAASAALVDARLGLDGLKAAEAKELTRLLANYRAKIGDVV